jgi:hypothetical protein
MTLPVLMPRASRELQTNKPHINYNKSIFLTSNEYLAMANQKTTRKVVVVEECECKHIEAEDQKKKRLEERARVEIYK